MQNIELENFYNHGFGWICKHCVREIKAPEIDSGKQSRLMREGEAESKSPRLSNRAMAKWADKEQRTLICPRCGLTELADKF
jgi:hypothetical protein